MNLPPSRVLVLTKVDMSGTIDTGRTVMRDGIYRPILAEAPKAHAMVWCRLDVSDKTIYSYERKRAKQFADKEGYKVHLMDDTDDLLDKARAHALKVYNYKHKVTP